MKFIQIYVPVFLITALIFSGCHTKFNAVESDDTNASYIEYPTGNYGIDLASDMNLLWITHPNSDGLSSRSFRTLSPWTVLSTSYHPPYFSNNPYMHSFYYNNIAFWAYWKTAFPAYWENSNTFTGIYNNSQGFDAQNSTSTSGNVRGGINSGDREIRTEIDVDGSDFSSRERTFSPYASGEELYNRQRNLRDRHGAESIERMMRQRSSLSPLSSWSNWEQRAQYGERTGARSSGINNRTAGSHSTGNTAVRGNSTNRGGESVNTERTTGSNRSSGEGSSSRGNN